MTLPNNVTKIFGQFFSKFTLFYILKTKSPRINSQILGEDAPHAPPCSYCRLKSYQDKWLCTLLHVMEARIRKALKNRGRIS